MASPLKFRTSLLKCARLLSLEINQLLKPLQLNYSLWQVLYVLERYPQCTALDLAHELRISKPSLSKRIQYLTEAGWIEQVSTLDKRQKSLQLTLSGENLHHQCTQLISNYEEQLLSDLEIEHREIAHTVLDQLLAKLQLTEQPHDV